MHSVLQQMHDFKYEKTKLENVLVSYGYRVYLFQNFTVSSTPLKECGRKAKNTHVHTVTIRSKDLRVPSLPHLIASHWIASGSSLERQGST